MMLAHTVFFSLKDRSVPARARLVDACYKYLKDHPGVEYFSAGVVAEELAREVNDRDFDVSLHVVFRTKADHDRYQDAPKHKQFIQENQANLGEGPCLRQLREVRAFGDPIDACSLVSEWDHPRTSRKTLRLRFCSVRRPDRLHPGA